MITIEKKKKLLLFLLIALTFLSRAGLGLRDDQSLASRVHYDDSFYIHSVSWNLAQGKGLTVDGTHKTNGIQPLIAFLDAPFYMIASTDKWMGLKLSFLLAALIDSLSVLMIYRILSLLSNSDDKQNIFTASIIGSFFWTFLYSVIFHTMNGLETGLYSLLLLVCSYIYISHSKLLQQNIEPTVRQKVVFGFILGCTVLSRIDAVFLVIIFLCFDFFYYKIRRAGLLLAAPVTALLVSSPWWIYNITTFGNIIPISGQSESIGASLLSKNILFFCVACADIASTFFYLPFTLISTWAFFIWFIGVFALLYFLGKRFQILRRIQQTYDTVPLLPILFFGMTLGIIYVFFFQAPYFIARYLQPVRIYWLLIAALIFSVVMEKRKTTSRSFTVVGIAALLFAFCFNIMQYVRDYTVSNVSTLYVTGLWAQQHPSYTIGMQQSGIASFMSDNVTNLDGKVNAEILASIKKGERGKYIHSHHLDYIIDWGELARIPAMESNFFGSNYQLTDSSGLKDSTGLLKIYKDYNNSFLK